MRVAWNAKCGLLEGRYAIVNQDVLVESFVDLVLVVFEIVETLLLVSDLLRQIIDVQTIQQVLLRVCLIEEAENIVAD